MRKLTRILTVLVLIAVTSTMIGVGSTAAETGCDSKSGVKFCIEEVTISQQKVEKGEETILTVTVKNAGNRTGSAVIILGFQQPEGGYTYGKSKTVHDLSPKEEQSVDVPITTENSGPTGSHEINIMLFDEPQQHMYDSTGYYHAIVVEESPLDVFKWVSGINDFARALIAIAAIAGALLGKRFL